MKQPVQRTVFGRVIPALLLVAAVIAVVILGGCSGEDILGQNDKGSLRGIVFDGPGGTTRLPGVRLFLVSRETVTDVNGEYEFTNIPVGSQQLSAYKSGYRSYNATIQIREDNADDPIANRHSFFMTLE